MGNKLPLQTKVMNARTAIEENTRLINELFNSAKELSERKGISVEAAIDFKVSVAMKYAKNDNEECAIDLRAKKAKEMVLIQSNKTKKEVKIEKRNAILKGINPKATNVEAIHMGLAAIFGHGKVTIVENGTCKEYKMHHIFVQNQSISYIIK